MTFIRLKLSFEKKINKFFPCHEYISNNIDRTTVHLYYRISDAGYEKVKPEYINNENCLFNAVKTFPIKCVDWHVIADNCSKETLSMIYKYIPKEKVLQVSFGHGAGTFNRALDDALRQDDNDIVYFLEDDFLHTPDALDALFDGFSFKYGNDYVGLYDHPDKYDVHHVIYNFLKKTEIKRGHICHWRTTNSTTLSFATKVKTLKKDEKIFRKWTNERHPHSFEIFNTLKLHHRILISPIPSKATHGETEFLAPFVNWEALTK